MARLRSNNVFGTTTNNPLAAGGTSLSSAGLANLVAVAGADRAVITLDPNRVHGAPEIVYVSAHTAGMGVATILRGQEGTVARSHPAGTFWVHGATAAELAVGQAAYAQVTANQGSIASTTPVDLTGLSVTFTAVAGRRYRVEGRVLMQSSIGTDIARLTLATGAGVRVQLDDQTLAHLKSLYIPHFVTPGAGSTTYKLQASRAVGTGTITMTADPTFPAYIAVEDAGWA